jgi:hypothetical protein
VPESFRMRNGEGILDGGMFGLCSGPASLSDVVVLEATAAPLEVGIMSDIGTKLPLVSGDVVELVCT